jgi:hypothetical protein
MVRSRVASYLGLVVPVVVTLVVTTALGVVRAGPGFVSAASSADVQLDTAADQMESTLRGTGFTFTVVSRSTLHARPDGPKIEVPHPTDRFVTIGLADEYYVGASIATGIVTPDGYFLQMRRGPATPDAAPDFEKAEPTLAALVTGGKTFRNDGAGWYATDTPPGIGLDPRTVALLPKLLRNATDPAAGDTKLVDGLAATTVAARGKVADAPGLMAIDAEPFTDLVAPIEFALDDQGRLVELHALMRNTNQETFDLLVDTVITISYEDPGKLPAPVPTWNPAS